MAANRPTFDPDRIGGPPAAAGMLRTLTVSQLNGLIKQVLGDTLPGNIHLVGQVSNCCRHASGHLYMTLKDERSEIRAVMWRSGVAGLKFEPADGLAVIATGYVDVYENRGQYQFYISRLEPRGVGALELAFRQLHDKLAREGLFAPERKRLIPRLPRRIGVVTSRSGAALRDILQAVRRRCRCVSVLLHPVRVQGEGAAAEIAAAVRRLNAQNEALGGIDVIIVARGGGSLEDLWPFNEEIVARAIFESRIPVISGVGHEVDVTIADLVADLRAPTPTAAAELAVPVLEEVLAQLAAQQSRLTRAVRHRLDFARHRIDAVQRVELFRNPLEYLHHCEQHVDEVASRLQLCAAQRCDRARQRVHQLEKRLSGAPPHLSLDRQRQRLQRVADRFRWGILQQFRRADHRLLLVQQALRPVLSRRTYQPEREHLRQLGHRLEAALHHRLQVARHNLAGCVTRLEATSYRSVLRRGFTITRTRRGKQIVTSPGSVLPGDRVLTETAEGTFESRVLDSKQGELFET